MKTSPAGISALAFREGIRTQAYQDIRGIWTIGVGHTGPEVHRGLVWKLSEVLIQLTKDVSICEASINTRVKVKLTQNQFDALVSVAFNIGVFGFAGSTFLLLLNQGRYAAAADAMLAWNKPAALIPRRKSERRQFLTP